MTPSPASATPSALGITEHATAKQQQQPAAAGEPGDGTWDGDVERLSSAVG